jgi:hypothetical protein
MTNMNYRKMQVSEFIPTHTVVHNVSYDATGNGFAKK